MKTEETETEDTTVLNTELLTVLNTELSTVLNTELDQPLRVAYNYLKTIYYFMGVIVIKRTFSLLVSVLIMFSIVVNPSADGSFDRTAVPVQANFTAAILDDIPGIGTALTGFETEGAFNDNHGTEVLDSADAFSKAEVLDSADAFSKAEVLESADAFSKAEVLESADAFSEAGAFSCGSPVLDNGISASIKTFQEEEASSGGPNHNGYIVKLKRNAPILFAFNASMGHIGDSKFFVADNLEELEGFVQKYQDHVEYVEPNNTVRLFSQPPRPNDPEYDNYQWSLQVTGMESVFAMGLDGNGVKVGFIDSGIYRAHEDLDASRITGGNTAEDGLPYIEDLTGHGTFAAGIVAAQTGNGIGIAGIAPKAHIAAYRAFVGEDAPYTAVAAAINAAVANNCDIINMSFGSPDTSKLMKDAIDYAENNGIIMIAAVGNDSSTIYNYPAAYESVIGVGSVDSNLFNSGFSNRNDSVYVTAPGRSIRSLGRNDNPKYVTGNGTSYAAPFVTGLAALALAYDGDIADEGIRYLLRKTSTDSGTPGYDHSYGHGIVNAAAFAEELTRTFSIEYELDRGELPLGAKDTYKLTDASYSLPTPSRTGYEFAGWHEAIDLTGTPTSTIPAGSLGDRVYYAKWVWNPYVALTSVIVDGYTAIWHEGNDHTRFWNNSNDHTIFWNDGNRKRILDDRSGGSGDSSSDGGVIVGSSGDSSSDGGVIVGSSGSVIVSGGSDGSDEEGYYLAKVPYLTDLTALTSNNIIATPAQPGASVTVTKSASDISGATWLISVVSGITSMDYELRIEKIPLHVTAGQGTQVGQASPASLDGLTAAVAFSADARQWFTYGDGQEPLTGFTCEATLEIGNGLLVVGADGYTIHYTPVLHDASKDVRISVRGVMNNQKTLDAVSLTIQVSSLPVSQSTAESPATFDVFKPQNTELILNLYGNQITSVAVNGSVLSQSLYELSEISIDGKNKLILHPSAVSSLSLGNHTVVVSFNVGGACTVVLAVIDSAGIFTVTFIDRGATYHTLHGVREGSTVSLPSQPTNQGHSFDGWYTTANTKFTNVTTVLQNTVLYARWSAISGGSGPGGPPPGGGGNPPGGGADPVGTPPSGNDETGAVDDDSALSDSESQFIVEEGETGAESQIATLAPPAPNPPPGVLQDQTSSGTQLLLSSKFTDVSETDWFIGDIEFVLENGLMSGTSEDSMSFSPNMTLTRAMIVTIMFRHSGMPETDGAENPFSDVADAQWYSNAIIWAAREGVVGGYGDGMFGLNDPVTRQDLAVILMRYAGFAGIAPTIVREYTDFTDDADIANYSKEAVKQAYCFGIIGGYPDGSFNPSGTATRAEAAAMLHRFLATA